MTGNAAAAVLHNGLLGVPLAPALAGYPFGARAPGKNIYYLINFYCYIHSLIGTVTEILLYVDQNYRNI